MADQSVSIEMKATTAAAVAEVDKLSGAIRESTTAATVAGSAQQQLGKDVALTRAKQIEATEAVRAAKTALETHNATVAAFGVNSTQAAQSAAKLAAAEREASKAATEAAAALARTAKEVQAVAAAEDGNLTPATKRAAAQVARMGETADKTAHELQRMELAQKKGSAGFDLMGMASGKLMSVLGPAALGGTIVALAGWLGDAAGATMQYETAVANLPYTVDAARKSTHGLISDQALVAAAANASALGVAKTSDKFAGLADAVTKLAKPGQDVAGLLNEITGALGRGSSESLNNANVILTLGEAQKRYAESLGVTVASLTDEQKAEAFKVEGLKAVIAAAEQTTIAYDGNAAAVVRMKVKTTDAWDAVTRAAVNGAGSLFTTVESASTAVTTMQRGLIETALAMDTTWSPAFKSGATDAATWAAELLGVADTVDGLRRGFTDPSVLAAMDAANDKERAKRDMLSEEADFSERMAKAAANVEKANTAFLDAQAAAAVVYGPAAPEKVKRKAGGKAKPDAEFTDPGSVAAARTFDGREQTELVARAAPESAAEGRAEAEQRRFDQETIRNQRASEMLVERVGLETQVEAERAALQDQQLARERTHARWQVANARSTEQREQALTRVEEIEHRKRVIAATREAAEEKRLAEQRAATFEKIGGAASSLSSTIVAATWEQAQGQKGAIAQMLGDRLKGISIDATVTAAWEAAQGVAALAGVYTAGLAPGHFAAAAESAAVAILAGSVGAGLGASGKAASGGGTSGAGGRERPAGAADLGGGAWATQADGTVLTAKEQAAREAPMESRNLGRMDVPVSYDRTGPAPGGPTIIIQIANFTGGKDAAKALGEQVKRSLGQSKAQGKRY